MTRRTVLATAVAAGAATVLVPSSADAAAPRADTLLGWYDLTATTIGVITGPQQVTNSRTWAVAAGADAARAVLAERAGDGLDLASVNRPFTPPAAAPGVWQPTPPAFAAAVQAGQGDGRPFLVRGVKPLQPGPPPALGSDVYLRDLAESRAVGAVDSAVRTPRQTAVARFWSQTSLNGFTGALRTTVAPPGSHAADRRARAATVEPIGLMPPGA